VRSLPAGLPVAYHAACSLQHGQKIRDLPKEVLKRLGITPLEPAEPHICCGSAGTYNMPQPELAGRPQGAEPAPHRGSGGGGGQSGLPDPDCRASARDALHPHRGPADRCRKGWRG
jgi:glycolate oxidase iron-sulfur subunit